MPLFGASQLHEPPYADRRIQKWRAQGTRSLSREHGCLGIGGAQEVGVK